MKHYTFADKLHALYTKACGLYSGGQRGAETYFTPEETAWLASNGLTPQHVYDYAEDDTGGSGPGWDKALPIESVRRDYFLNVQGGKAPGRTLDEPKMPTKTDAVEGITWLPRIIPKAKAKLRGELPASLMYCCGGDRRFFQEHDINPAEFLSLVWRNENDDKAIVNWVVARSRSKS
ncbi:MAG: hypothetical protein JWQ62_2063 [Lacunisphaera sp.]|nr:hypothetical protein [Lacunisphaera sp.]